MRRPAQILLLALAALQLTACVTLAPMSRRTSDSAQVIPDVPVRRWGDNTCGSGALSTVLNHYGEKVTEAELDARFAKGRNGGVVSLDLLLEARSRGYHAELVPGDEALVKKLLSEQKPVVIMVRVLNMPARSRDLFHYVVLDGIDPKRDLVRMQFGRGKPRWARLRSIERAWAPTGRATFVVHGRSENRLSRDELLRRAVALHESGKPHAAIAIYEELAGQSSDALVLTNLANARRDAGDLVGAERDYRAAVSVDATNRDALNNLAWLLFEAKRTDEAAAFIRQAVVLDGTDHDLILDTAGDIEAALGRCDAAIDALERAVTAAPASRKSGVEAKLEATRRNCPPA